MLTVAFSLLGYHEWRYDGLSTNNIKIVNNMSSLLVPSMVISGLTKQETDIVIRLHAAIMEQRLLPGTRLTEEELVDIFKVSRMRVRRVLLALSHTGLIELPPGRGAIVARPSVESARHIFATRQLIEGTLLQAPLTQPAAKTIKLLYKLCEQENEAIDAKDRTTSIQLSCALHVSLVSAYGNSVLAEIVTGLVSRSALIIAFYQSKDLTCCRTNEHKHIITLLEKKNFETAGAEMREHLKRIETNLNLDQIVADQEDLRRILAP